MTNSNRTLDKLGAVAGLATVALFVVTIQVTPALLSPNHSLEKITSSVRGDTAGYLRGIFFGLLITGTLLIFGTVVAARLRRSDPGADGWWLITLVGTAATSVGVTVDMTVMTFVRAVGHGVHGTPLWSGYPAGADGVILAVPLAVFFLGVGLGTRFAGGLPRRLGWFALVLAALFAAGTASVMGDEVDGGAFGVPLLLGFLGFLIWTVWTSISLWRVSAP